MHEGGRPQPANVATPAAPRLRAAGDGSGAYGARRIPSGVLRRDGLDDGCGVLGCVDRPLEPEIDVPPADYDHWVATTGEQRGEGLAEEPVAVVLDPVDLDPVLVEVLEPTHVLEQRGELLARL